MQQCMKYRICDRLIDEYEIADYIAAGTTCVRYRSTPAKYKEGIRL